MPNATMPAKAMLILIVPAVVFAQQIFPTAKTAPRAPIVLEALCWNLLKPTLKPTKTLNKHLKKLL
jgi:hypothetical protein